MAKAKPDDQFLVHKIELLPTNSLKRWKNNPRHNETAIEPVAASIKKFGMLVPLLINKKNEIIAGDTRYQAALKLGLRKVPCVRADHLSKEEQVAFNIADNKLGEIATWNQDMVKDIMAQLQQSFSGTFDYTLLGYQSAEMELLQNGWQSNSQRIGDVKSDSSAAPGKIVIECLGVDEELLRTQLQLFLDESTFKETKIR